MGSWALCCDVCSIQYLIVLFSEDTNGVGDFSRLCVPRCVRTVPGLVGWGGEPEAQHVGAVRRAGQGELLAVALLAGFSALRRVAVFLELLSQVTLGDSRPKVGCSWEEPLGAAGRGWPPVPRWVTSSWISIWQEGERLPWARCCGWLTFWRPGCLLVLRPSARLQASAGAPCFCQCSVSNQGPQGLCSGVCNPSDSWEVSRFALGFFPVFFGWSFFFFGSLLVLLELVVLKEKQVLKHTLCFE